MKEIEEFFKTYKNAVWQKDAVTLFKLYHKNTLSFDMWDKGFYINLQEWAPEIESWINSLGNENVNVEFEMIHIHKSNSVSFASGLIVFQAISANGTILRSMKNRITIGFSRFENEWKVVHQHISAPVKSEDLTAILEIS